uniref:DUF1618 domain-containing protein n=1 Tax=Leersia perrieri TaxID=77586 RepID=A0A0D9XTB8_9ORYZ
MAAECPTSWGGQPMRVAIDRAAPPATSFVRYDESATAGVHVVAAHGDSVLLAVTIPKNKFQLRFPLHDPSNVSNNTNYFVYKAGAAACGAGQPPSLSRLPACEIPMTERHCDYEDMVYPRERHFGQINTGILRLRGCSSLTPLMAQLLPSFDAPFDTADLCVLRPGSQNWELKTEVPIVHHNGGGEGEGEERRHDLERWTPIPSKKNDFDDDIKKQPRWHYNRSIGAGGSAADTVKFVSIDNRCCCGAPVTTSLCAHSSSAFMVTMWTLSLKKTRGEPMVWVKDSVLDCEELWALLAASGKGITQVDVVSPIVSLENPDVVCFMAYHDGQDGEREMWTLEIDMARKRLMSVVPYPPHSNRWVHRGLHLPAKLHG